MNPPPPQKNASQSPKIMTSNRLFCLTNVSKIKKILRLKVHYVVLENQFKLTNVLFTH